MVSVLSFYILNIHSFVFQKVNILVSVAAVLWERSLKRHHILLHIIVQCSPRRHNFGFIVQARTNTVPCESSLWRHYFLSQPKFLPLYSDNVSFEVL